MLRKIVMPYEGRSTDVAKEIARFQQELRDATDVLGILKKPSVSRKMAEGLYIEKARPTRRKE